MYHILLTNRYLTTRVIPLIAVAAVALCVALVIIVVSVMTGFLDMVKDSGRTLMGDVVVSYPVSGLPYYDRLIERIEALDEAEAATPLVDGWGLLKMPYPEGRRKETETVQFWAVEPQSFGDVTGFRETLYWRPPEEDEVGAMGDGDFRRELLEAIGEEGMERAYQDALQLEYHDAEGRATPGVVPGMHVSAGNERQKDGSYRPVRDRWWMPQHEVILTALPVDAISAPEPESAVLRVVNEFVSGVFLIDDKRIIIPLQVGQDLLHLDEAQIVDEEGEETGFIDPPRATMVLVRAAEGVTPEALRERIAGAYETFRGDLLADHSVAMELIPPPEGFGVGVQTWLQQQRQFIAPIEKERELMRVLFSIVYLVCAGLVLSIFWAIVYEKTRDIGILRSIGASRMGISLIFLRYGAIIGAIGSIVGLGLAFLIVRNINSIHGAMGKQAPMWLWIGLFILAGPALLMTVWRARKGLLLPVVMWTLITLVLAGLGVGLMFHKGTLIWDPSVYYFSEIPNTMDPFTAVTTMIGAVIFSVLGAFFPAAKAADTDPVRALRYE
ncbi:MAG: FtsX-like permease family protein [Planctomycetota bacterium]|nr:FtsX-like permease family protein [Planctomycetota bacterium]